MAGLNGSQEAVGSYMVETISRKALKRAYKQAKRAAEDLALRDQREQAERVGSGA